MKSRLSLTSGIRARYYTDGGPATPPTYSLASWPNAVSDDFKVLISVPHGTAEFNPHSFTRDSRRFFFGKEERVWRSAKGVQYRKAELVGYVVGEPPVLQASLPDDSYNRALGKVYDKIRSSVDLSIDLAEAGKTFKMLRTAATLSHLILSVHPKNWSRRIVEFQLGWRPLVSSLYEATKQAMQVAPQMIRVKERATSSYDRVVIGSPEPGISSVRNEHSSFRTEFVVVYTPTGQSLEALARYASLNPASIAWELLPFSFLVDYVFNIGQVLRLAESSLILTGSARGCVTTTSLRRVNEERTGNGNSYGDLSVTGSYSGSRELRSKNRSVINSLPLPHAPVFRPRLGASRLITVSALLTTFMTSSHRQVKKRRKMTRIEIDRRLVNFARGPKKQRWQETDYTIL